MPDQTISDQAARAQDFHELHRQDKPLIIYNAWDGGSARAIADSGAKAVATGDHPVGFAHGFTNDDFSDFSFDMYLATIEDITRVLDGKLPFSVDISNGEGLDESSLQERVRILLELDVVGVNFEDRLPDDSGVQPIEVQVKRIAAIRSTAEQYGVPLFINARSDLFALNDKAQHAGLLDEAIERARAYKQAGASGFFAPGLIDLELIKSLCQQAELPVNIIRLPGSPSAKDLTAAGMSRISYGPVPQMQMIEWLKQKASAALRGDD